MKTPRMMIDMNDSLVKVRFKDEEVNFNLFEVIKHPNEKGVCYNIDVNDEAEKIEKISDISQ